MKKQLFRFITVCLFFCGSIPWASGQLLSEDFDYSDALTAHGWNNHSNVLTNPLSPTATGLVYAGLSAAGNAVPMATSGMDLNKSLSSSVNTGSLYTSFLVNVSAASAAGDYFLHLMPSATGTTFLARVYIKAGTNGFQVGISKNSASNDFPTAYTTGSYAYGSTHLIILKYTFVSGAANDIAGIYVNPSLTSEPTQLDAVHTSTQADLTSAASVALRQGTATSAPSMTIDRIRVATSWAPLVAGTPAAAFSPSSLSTVLKYQVGNGPADSSFTFSGSNLSTDGTITVASNSSAGSVLVSADNVTFGSSVNFPYTGNSFTDKVIYTRLAAGLDFGNYSTSLSISGGGASTSVSINASVTNSTNCPTTGTMDIACAREIALLLPAPGNVNSSNTVTVTGTVTVGPQFTGETFYIQDATGGVAIYGGSRPGLNRKVGDVITVTGNVTYYYGLVEIVNPTITLVSAGTGVGPNPATLTSVSDMNSLPNQGKLVNLDNVTVTDSRPYFCVRQNYSFATPTGTGELRIQPGVTDLMNSKKPSSAVVLAGILDSYDPDDNPATSNSTYQIQPRGNADLPNTEEFTPAAASLPKSQTLDVASWNLEWLGNGNGPIYRGTNYDTQVANAATVMTAINADVFVIPETVDEAVLQRITNNVSANLGVTYAKLCPPVDGSCGSHSASNQKMCFVYNTSVLTNVTTTCLSNFTAANWASGRFPFQMNADVTINGLTQNVSFIAIHAKAQDDAASYNQRLNAATELHNYISTSLPNSYVVMLGDWNDDMDQSITLTNGVPNATPYTPFTDNPSQYSVLTLPLSQQGFGSTMTYDNMIDHIVITNEFGTTDAGGRTAAAAVSYISGTAGTISGDFIPGIDILNTTSDHVPVFARFAFNEVPTPVSLIEFKGRLTENEQVELNWQTATERNNSHFEIQRSKDGKTFETIGTVKGQGNAMQPHSYAFVDEQPYAGMNYFKLKQLDTDGKFEYSKTISLELGDPLKVGPNPTTGVVKVTGKNIESLELKALTGQSLKKSTLTEIRLDELPAGTYFLEIRQKNQQITRQLIVKQ